MKRITGAANQILEDYARMQVPVQKGRNYVQLTMVFLAVCIGVPPLLLGSALAAGMGLNKAASAILWSSLIATPICLLASHVGTRSRLSTGMTLKFAFGGTGAKVIAAIIALDMLCWSAMNTEIFGSSVRHTAASIWTVELSESLLCLIVGILITVITVFGYRSVEKFAFIVVPLLTAVLLAYLLHNFAKSPFSEIAARSAFADPISYATAMSVVVGSYLNLSVFLPDITRYAKNGVHAATAVIFGLCVGLPVFTLIACYLTAATAESDFVKLMILQGWGLAAIVVVAAACWFHINALLYSASLNLAAIIPGVPTWKLTVFAGLAGTAVALFGIVSRYVPFLIILSVVVPPITGVYTADYLLHRKLYKSGQFDDINRFRPLALVAWAAGVAVGFMTAERGELGFGLFNLTYLPAIDSFCISFAFQSAFGRLTGLSTERV